jgi:hypothetical protein
VWLALRNAAPGERPPIINALADLLRPWGSSRPDHRRQRLARRHDNLLDMQVRQEIKSASGKRQAQRGWLFPLLLRRVVNPARPRC